MYKSNETIIHEWNQTEVAQRISDSEMFAINHGFEEWKKPTIVDFWINLRLQDLQAIKEMVEGINDNGGGSGRRFKIQLLGQLDELMNK